MAVNNLQLIKPQTMAASGSPQYTVEGDVLNAEIDKFTATNNSGSNATISVHIIPNNESAADSNKIIKEITLAAGEDKSFTALVGHRLMLGDAIYAFGTGSAITIMCSGREIS